MPDPLLALLIPLLRRPVWRFSGLARPAAPGALFRR